MKRVIVIILAIMLCLAIFSGCDKSKASCGFFLRREADEAPGDQEAIVIQTIDENGALIGNAADGEGKFVIYLDEDVVLHDSQP